MNSENFQKVKALVHTSAILSQQERDEWLMLLELMNDKQLGELEKILSLGAPTAVKPDPARPGLSHIMNMPQVGGQQQSKPTLPVQPPVAKPTPEPVQKQPEKPVISPAQPHPKAPQQTSAPVISSQPIVKVQQPAEVSRFAKWLKGVVSEKELTDGVKEVAPKRSAPVVAPVMPPIQIVISKSDDGDEVKVKTPDGRELASKIIQDPQPKKPEPMAEKPVQKPVPPPVVPVAKKPEPAPEIKKSTPPVLAAKPVEPVQPVADNTGKPQEITPDALKASMAAKNAADEPAWKKVSMKKIGGGDSGMPDLSGIHKAVDAPKEAKITEPALKATGLTNIPFNFNGNGAKVISLPKAFGAKLEKPIFDPTQLINQPPFLQDVTELKNVSIDDWRKKQAIAVGATVLSFIRIKGYHEAMDYFEHSPLYTAYINTGLKLLNASKTFDQWETERKDADQYFTKKEFEEFTDMIRLVQSLS